MADSVKWIKLKVGMFDGKSFKRIKRTKIGGVSYRDKLTSVWFELLDLAGSCNNSGLLFDVQEFPYSNIEDIAIAIDREVEELQLCMSFFEREGMIEIINDVYMLSNWSKYQNEDKLEKIRKANRERQARFRATQREKIPENNVTFDDSNVTRNVTVTLDCSYSNSLSSSYSNNSENNINNNIYNNIESQKKYDIEGFEAFWKAWPKKVAKEDARKAWAKLNPSVELQEVMGKALEIQKNSNQWKKENGNFIPYPGTWIRGRRWEDEIKVEDLTDAMFDRVKQKAIEIDRSNGNENAGKGGFWDGLE